MIPIETLVQQYLNAQGQAVAAYEAEIDTIVARLYGLTEAERAIIEGREGWKEGDLIWHR